MVLLKDADGHHAILKHLAFPDKVKPSFLKGVVFGTPQRAKWMSWQIPKVGRKVLQYCLEGLGGRQFKCFELSSQVTNKKIGKAIPFEDKEDEEIDAGFDYILKHGPCSSSEMAQLRWQTKAIRKENSPICGWPTGLVEKALRNLASDGALARKEFSWPIPLTLRYYAPWLLKCLEGLWDFDQSSLVMLGEAGVGKSPLGRSVLNGTSQVQQSAFQPWRWTMYQMHPRDWLLEGGGWVLSWWGISWMTHPFPFFPSKWLKPSWMWAYMNPCAGPGGGPPSGYKMSPVQLLTIPMMMVSNCHQVSSPKSASKLSTTWFGQPSPIQASKAHMDAIFKRTAFLVNSKEHLYFRPAGINTDPVQRISHANLWVLDRRR